MDLTTDVPRSPYESLGGIVFLPRAIDKGRAELADTLGDYIARTGFSKRLFDLLGIAAGDFIEALRTRSTDAEMWGWVSEQMAPRTPDEIADWNSGMMTRSPVTPEGWQRLRRLLEEMGQGHRTDITRSFDRLDLDEGREVPIGGRR